MKLSAGHFLTVLVGALLGALVTWTALDRPPCPDVARPRAVEVESRVELPSMPRPNVKWFRRGPDGEALNQKRPP